MTTSKRMAMVMALAGLGLGCGDDANPGGNETGGSDSSGTSMGTTTSTPTTTGVDSSGDSGGSGSGGSEESSSSGGPVEVTVEGEVQDFIAMSAIPDVDITIYDDPTLTTTADGDGVFSLGPFMPNTGALFVLAPSDEYWGAIIPIDIGTDPIQENVALSQISTMIVDMQIDGLMDQMPQPPDLTQAIIITRLLNNTAVMEGPVTIDMSPAPPAGTFYAPDAGGVPVLDQSDIEFLALPVVVFFNVADTEPGEITFTASHPERDCTILYPELPTLGEHITLVDVECPAP